MSNPMTSREGNSPAQMGGPRELFDAVGDLALAIAPHNMDTNQRAKIKAALHVLVDHIIAVGETRARAAKEGRE